MQRVKAYFCVVDQSGAERAGSVLIAVAVFGRPPAAARESEIFMRSRLDFGLEGPITARQPILPHRLTEIAALDGSSAAVAADPVQLTALVGPHVLPAMLMGADLANMG